MPRTYQYLYLISSYISSYLYLDILTSDEWEQTEYLLAIHSASGKWHRWSRSFCAFSRLIFSSWAYHEEQPRKIMIMYHKQCNVQLLLEGACSAWPCRKCAYNRKQNRNKRQETVPGLDRMEKYQWHWPGKSNLNWIVQIINDAIRILQLSRILLCTTLITCQTSSACVHQCNLLKCYFSAVTDYYRQKEVSHTTGRPCQRPGAKKPFPVTTLLF